MGGVPEFAHRGVVEGFYGRPYAHADRLWLLEQMGRWGMNRYVHAPKNDPLHRDRWREPYGREALAELGALVAHGAEHGVEVGFAVSPGLSMEYASREDREALARKLGAFHGLGARFFGLALDDVPSRLVHEGDRRAFPGLAEAHVAVAHELLGRLEDSRLWLVPTDYSGAEPTDYLETLGATLEPAVEVGWTGRPIVSPTVRADEARRRARTLRRPLLLWDNVPVSDGPMRSLLHLGPYLGREPGLAEHCSGVLLNPMEHPRASGVALQCAARFLADPAGYDPEAAWETALAERGAGAPEAFRRFAEALRFSALAPGERDRELEAAGVHGSRKLEARALELRGRCLVAMDRRDEATEALDRALEIARRLGNPPVQWRALALLAELARRAGDGAGSERHANAARQLAEAHSRTLTDAGLRRSLHALADGLVADPLGRRR